MLEAFVERRARAAAEEGAVAVAGGGAAAAEAEVGGGERRGRAAGVWRAERCLLLMDPHAVAVAPLTAVCKRWGMYSALAYHYTRGIGDFVSPLSVLLGAVSKFADSDAAAKQEEGFCDPRELAMLVCLYLDYSFGGHEFPSKAALPADVALAAAAQLSAALLGMLSASSGSRSAANLGAVLRLAGATLLRVVADLLRSERITPESSMADVANVPCPPVQYCTQSLHHSTESLPDQYVWAS